jgi:hypothetical protein
MNKHKSNCKAKVNKTIQDINDGIIKNNNNITGSVYFQMNRFNIKFDL